MKIGLKIARKLVDLITAAVSTDQGEPIAVTVVGADGKRIASVSMDGVIPASIGLDENKAYTAIQVQKPTLDLEKAGLDGRNFTDPKITCFGGGVPVIIKGEVVGAIGVSGRHSSKKNFPIDAPLQDHELAELGVKYLVSISS